MINLSLPPLCLSAGNTRTANFRHRTGSCLMTSTIPDCHPAFDKRHDLLQSSSHCVVMLTHSECILPSSWGGDLDSSDRRERAPDTDHRNYLLCVGKQFIVPFILFFSVFCNIVATEWLTIRLQIVKIPG